MHEILLKCSVCNRKLITIVGEEFTSVPKIVTVTCPCGYWSDPTEINVAIVAFTKEEGISVRDIEEEGDLIKVIT